MMGVSHPDAELLIQELPPRDDDDVENSVTMMSISFALGPVAASTFPFLLPRRSKKLEIVSLCLKFADGLRQCRNQSSSAGPG